MAIYGTKIEASASKRRYISKTKLTKMKEKIQSQINDLDIYICPEGNCL